MGNKRKGDPTQEKLDRIIDLLEDLLVVQGGRAGIGWKDLTKIARVGGSRVSQITKNITERN